MSLHSPPAGCGELDSFGRNGLRVPSRQSTRLEPYLSAQRDPHCPKPHTRIGSSLRYSHLGGWHHRDCLRPGFQGENMEHIECWVAERPNNRACQARSTPEHKRRASFGTLHSARARDAWKFWVHSYRDFPRGRSFRSPTLWTRASTLLMCSVPSPSCSESRRRAQVSRRSWAEVNAVHSCAMPRAY